MTRADYATESENNSERWDAGKKVRNCLFTSKVRLGSPMRK